MNLQAQILAPAAALVIWTLVMLIWLAATRLPPMFKQPGGLGAAKPGGRGVDLEGVLPDSVQWKSHNYTHLLEQPVLFYAVIGILAIMGPNETNVLMAWGYVALRIIHSLWQATINTVTVRFTLFILSTVCLLALAIHAAKLTLFAV
jgi:hypothetical protein